MLADFRLFCSINIGQIGFFISIADALSYVTTKFAFVEKVNKLQEYEFFEVIPFEKFQSYHLLVNYCQLQHIILLGAL